MKKDLRTNSEGVSPEYSPGESVYHSHVRKHATVVEQTLHYGGLDTEFWGNVILIYDNDTVETVVPPWQLSRVVR
jgi:hypothetical protein